MHWKAWLFLVSAALMIAAADQASKLFAAAYLPLYEPWAPVPALTGVFTFTYTQNTGAAFSLFPRAGHLLKAIGFVTGGVIVYYYRILGAHHWSMRLALGLLLGGTLGNLVDRLRLGYVVDFLHVHGLPVFNVADIAIVAGMSLLLLNFWLQERAAVRAGIGADV